MVGENKKERKRTETNNDIAVSFGGLLLRWATLVACLLSFFFVDVARRLPHFVCLFCWRLVGWVKCGGPTLAWLRICRSGFCLSSVNQIGSDADNLSFWFPPKQIIQEIEVDRKLSDLFDGNFCWIQWGCFHQYTTNGGFIQTKCFPYSNWREMYI